MRCRSAVAVLALAACGEIEPPRQLPNDWAAIACDQLFRQTFPHDTIPRHFDVVKPDSLGGGRFRVLGLVVPSDVPPGSGPYGAYVCEYERRPDGTATALRVTRSD